MSGAFATASASPDFDTDESHPLTVRNSRGAVCNFLQSRNGRMMIIVSAIVLFVASFTLIIAAVVLDTQRSSAPPNLIFFLSDGMGPSSVTLARAFLNATGVRDSLYLDSLLIGAIQTASLDSRVTDSAAGATTYACGLRTFNNKVAVAYDNSACATILEALQRKGYKTGVVSTKSITDASPAAFTSHSVSRHWNQFIATQQVKQGFDLLMGGGFSFYNFPYGGAAKPIDVARNLGYTVVTSRDDMLANATKLPVLGLFADVDMAFVIDRQTNSPQQPSLTQMTKKALDLLSDASRRDNSSFALIVEGALIDICGHNNDAACQVREVAEYDETVKLVKDWIDKPGNENTVFVSVADHATGGLSLGTNYPGPTYPDPYIYHVSQLIPVDMSAQLLAQTVVNQNINPIGPFFFAHTRVNLTAEQETMLGQFRDARKVDRLRTAMGEIVSSGEYLGWSTWGHDGVDVGLYSYGLVSKKWKGSMRNDFIGQTLSELLGVTSIQKQITDELANFNTTGNPDGWRG